MSVFKEDTMEPNEENFEKIAINKYENIMGETEDYLWKWANLFKQSIIETEAFVWKWGSWFKEIIELLVSFSGNLSSILEKNGNKIFYLVLIGLLIYAFKTIADSIASFFNTTVKYAEFFRWLINYFFLALIIISQFVIIVFCELGKFCKNAYCDFKNLAKHQYVTIKAPPPPPPQPPAPRVYIPKTADDILTNLALQRISNPNFQIPYDELRQRKEFAKIPNNLIGIAISNKKYYIQKKMKKAAAEQNASVSLDYF